MTSNITYHSTEDLQRKRARLVLETERVKDQIMALRTPLDDVDDFIEELRALRMKFHALNALMNKTEA